MTPKAIDIMAAVSEMRVWEGRTPQDAEADADDVFAVLAETETTGIYAGSFRGKSAWERHTAGDELVQVVDGAAAVTVVVDGVHTVLQMTKGMVTMVPKGCWHRFDAPDGVSVMTMTPSPTDHIHAEDLPAEPAG